MAKRRSPTRYHLPVLVEQDADGTYLVSVPALRGCRSHGYSIAEAMRNIAEAAALCLQDERPTRHASFIGVRDLEIVA
jgi:predicted RNase H-like HicB family nuclease